MTGTGRQRRLPCQCTPDRLKKLQDTGNRRSVSIIAADGR